MAYEVAWKISCKVLHLRMYGEMPLQTFIEIDQHINEYLRQCDDQVTLIVEASSARVAPHGIESIKTTQTYLQSRQIARLIVVAENKVNRLAMLLLFNLCRPRLQFCTDLSQAYRYLEKSPMQ